MEIHLMNGTHSFNIYQTSAETVGELKDELGLESSATVNVNSQVAIDSTALTQDAVVAVVARDKKGGSNS